MPKIDEAMALAAMNPVVGMSGPHHASFIVNVMNHDKDLGDDGKVLTGVSKSLDMDDNLYGIDQNGRFFAKRKYDVMERKDIIECYKVNKDCTALIEEIEKEIQIPYDIRSVHKPSYIYEALTGHALLDENQMEYDSLCEKVQLDKMTAALAGVTQGSLQRAHNMQTGKQDKEAGCIPDYDFPQGTENMTVPGMALEGYEIGPEVYLHGNYFSYLTNGKLDKSKIPRKYLTYKPSYMSENLEPKFTTRVENKGNTNKVSLHYSSPNEDWKRKHQVKDTKNGHEEITVEKWEQNGQDLKNLREVANTKFYVEGETMYTLNEENSQTKFKFYHGSDKKFNILKANAFNAGNRLYPKSWSCFFWNDYKLAVNWAVFVVLREIYQEYKESSIKLTRPFGQHFQTGEDSYIFKVYLKKSEYKTYQSLARNKKAYVYTVSLSIDDIGIGNNNFQPEYTYDKDVKPDKIDTITIDDRLLDEIVTILPDKEYDKKRDWHNNKELMNPIRGNLNPFFGDMSDMFDKYAFVTRQVKQGKIKPGDDLEDIFKTYQKPVKESVTLEDGLFKSMGILNEAKLETNTLIPFKCEIKYCHQWVDNGVVKPIKGDPNPMLILHKDNKNWRVRTELLLFKDDKIFLCKQDTINQYGNKYKIPGGGIDDPKESIELGAARECEEALMIPKNVKYSGICIQKVYEKTPWWHPAGIKYDGSISFVCTGVYNKDFKGFVKKMHQDSTKNGHFYSWNEVKDLLSKEHKKLFKDYLESIGKFENVQESTEQLVDESVFSAFSLKGGPHLTLYHGSSEKVKEIIPNSFSVGNRFTDPSWSVFMFDDKRLAMAYAIGHTITTKYDEWFKKENIPIPLGWIEKDGLLKYKPVNIVDENYWDKIKEKVIGTKFYVYTLEAPIDKNLNIIGTAVSLPEYTYTGTPKVVKCDEFTMTKELLDMQYKPVSSAEYQKWKSKKMNKRSVYGPWIKYFVNMSTRGTKRKLVLKTLKLEPGSNLDFINDIIGPDDMHNNVGKWLSDKFQKLYIIGLSGAGKTTMSNKLGELLGVKVIHIDDVHHDISKANGGRDKWKSKYNQQERRDMIWKEVMKRAGNDKCIIEGGPLILHKVPDLENQPLIILGTSAITSTYRMIKRTLSNDKVQGIPALLSAYKNKSKIDMIKQMLSMIANLSKSNFKFDSQLDALRSKVTLEDGMMALLGVKN